MKKTFSILLALLMIAGALAVAPVTASAADQSVVIAQTDTVAQIQSNIQTKINAAASGDTVTVTGSKTGITETLTISIPADITVVWNATLSGDLYGVLLAISCPDADPGTFHMAGGTVTATGSYIIAMQGANINMTVSGGTVEHNGDGGAAIQSMYGGSLAITGGTVKSTAGYVLHLNESVAAYLAGTCTGVFLVSIMNDQYYGLIVEADTLAVPKDRDGGSAGLAKKAGAGEAEWDCAGAKPVIKFTVGDDALEMEWGNYAAGQPDGPDLTWLWIVLGIVGGLGILGAIAAAVIGIVVVAIAAIGGLAWWLLG